ncbi:hypothetical protein NXW71_05555 [Parabacteroides merdae]|nr:hypothetical protein [Parabacteroides merdae]
MDKRKGNTDLTEGKVWKVIVRFALPLLVGNLLQQFYNITDSIIVGQFRERRHWQRYRLPFSSITSSFRS